MTKPIVWNALVDVISSDDESDMEAVNDSAVNQSTDDAEEDFYKDTSPQDAVAKRAEMYHEYMKNIPIPRERGSLIPFTTWMGLGKSMKQLYGQPLHYLTNVLLKQWDQMRIGSEEEYTPLDIIMHPVKAEASIWLVEETHRRAASHHHVAKCWLSDPMHHSFVDSIFPRLGNNPTPLNRDEDTLF